MIIRLLGQDDVDAFRRIRLEALRTEPAAYSSRAEDWESLSDEEWRRRLTDNPVFVAFDGSEPVGIMGFIREHSAKMAHRATIVMVYLRETRRGTGLAAELLAALTDHARKSGIRQLELAVSVENRGAFRFYQRAGFTEVGRIQGGYLHEGREIDEILMARRIQD
ncbi:GNAT family N-acetyltransferase [Mesorhizobium sp. BAC0120]|uniref:GNAT family N-acetyltransferase n=1 Tax=Mesorhizobium sp. BAC0120 TaxID=3090670 RepID=UPI00298C5E62|nr:GNAT family N-acetyltransferase [Mesorhizobium sp. BAC0120]MDW6026199.1 GNAT family N-acetyltransferase [Mesorhizobium sp. BAC0120]